MKQADCPRYQRCSAAICPLWKSVLDQRMLKGERVCGVLLEYQKHESKAVLEALYGLEMIGVIHQASLEIKSRGGYLLLSALERASMTSSRLIATQKLNDR